jgi:hypothetical protein
MREIVHSLLAKIYRAEVALSDFTPQQRAGASVLSLHIQGKLKGMREALRMVDEQLRNDRDELDTLIELIAKSPSEDK